MGLISAPVSQGHPNLQVFSVFEQLHNRECVRSSQDLDKRTFATILSNASWLTRFTHRNDNHANKLPNGMGSTFAQGETSMPLRTVRSCRALIGLASLVSLFGFMSCSSGDDAGGASEEASAKAAYGPYSRNVIVQYERTRKDGTKQNSTTGVVGEKEIEGKNYWRAQLGDFASGSKSGMEAWMTMPTPDKMTWVGSEFWSTSFLPNPSGGASSNVLLDAPVDVNLSPPVGTPQTVSGSAQVDILGVKIPVTGNATYTLKNDNASVDTAAGPIHGCRHFEFQAASTSTDLLTKLGANSASGQAWYHPNLGFVRAEFEIPGKEKYVFDFFGSSEMGQATSGVNTIQGMRVLRTLETFDLNTYNVRQQFDADKDKHAKMLIEVRFAEEDKAKSEQQPPINIEFGTPTGYYPHELVVSPVSFFHPQDNGKGYKFWIAYVDQAAKNQPTNGIAYHIKATVPDYGSSPVKVTSRIVYHLYTP